MRRELLSYPSPGFDTETKFEMRFIIHNSVSSSRSMNFMV